MLLLSIAAIALCAACEKDDTAVAVGGRANGIVGGDAGEAMDDTESIASESTATTDEVDSDTEGEVGQSFGDDNSNEVLSVSWTDDAEISSVSKLSFTVSNITADQVISFSVSILCKSLLGEAEKKVGAVELESGESREFKLAATALPIRSAKIVSQLFVKVTRTVPQSDGEREVSTLVSSRYVRHENGFAKVRAYTEAQLASELGGVLFESALPTGETSAAALAGEVVGEKQEDGKEGVSLSFASSGLVDYDDAGNVIGVTTGFSMGSADVSEEVLP